MNQNKYRDIILNKIFKIPCNYSALSFLKLLRSISKYVKLDSYMLFSFNTEPDYIYLLRHRSVTVSSKMFEKQIDKISVNFDPSFYGDINEELFVPKDVVLNRGRYSIKFSIDKPLSKIFFRFNDDKKNLPYLYASISKINKYIRFIINIIENDELGNGKFNNLLSDIFQITDYYAKTFKINYYLRYQSKIGLNYIPSNYNRNMESDETILKLLFILFNKLNLGDEVKRYYAGPLVITIYPGEYILFSITDIVFNRSYRKLEDMDKKIKCICSYLINEYTTENNKLFNLKKEIISI